MSRTTRYGRFAVSAVVGFLLYPISLSAEEPLRIRVLSYNIHHGEGIDGKLDLQRISRVIEAVKPDLVAVQEVDKKTTRTNRVDQPAELARLTGMEVCFARNIDFEGGQYGNAILSKWKIQQHANKQLPVFDGGEQRGALVAVINPPNQVSPFLFLATHLDHRRDDKERLASANVINEMMRKRGNVPAILAGDLNDTPDSRVLEFFGKEWNTVNEKVLPTVPVVKPQRQIDYILVRPARRWKTIEVRVLDEAVASDHRAIFAVLELLADE